MEPTVMKTEAQLTKSGMQRTLDAVDRVLAPVTMWTAWAGAAALGFMTLVLLYAIFARKIFNAPLLGAGELTQLSLVIIVFAALGLDTFEHEKMLVDIVVNRFPKKVQGVLAPIMHFLSIIILLVLSQQLFVHAERVREFDQVTRILQYPMFVFEYVAALGILLLAIVYIRILIKDFNGASR